MTLLQDIGTVIGWGIALLGIVWAGYYVYLFLWDCAHDLPTGEPVDMDGLTEKDRSVRDEVDHILGKNY